MLRVVNCKSQTTMIYLTYYFLVLLNKVCDEKIEKNSNCVNFLKKKKKTSLKFYA